MISQQQEHDREQSGNCTNCGRKLNPDKIVMMELDSKTNKYYIKGVPNPKNSQGAFAFGSDCAKRINGRGRDE